MKMLIAFQKNSQNREATQAGEEGGLGGGAAAAAVFTGNESRTLRFSDRYAVFVFFKDSPFVRNSCLFQRFPRIL